MDSSREKACKNCGGKFMIEAEDGNFYKKIGVPPPTWCPECRMKRRFMWRNERNLYRQKCALTGKDIITCFAPDSGVVVYDRDVWWSDQLDPMKCGLEYDFKTPFFAQFRKLLERVPMPAVFNSNCVNSNYCNHTGESKDCYLASACWRSENISYSSRCHLSKDCSDVFAVSQCELSYEDISSMKLYKTFFSENCENCTDSYFLYDCKGCSNCFGSVNLRNKQYYIFNEAYSKEEYGKKLKEFDLGSYNNVLRIAAKFSELKSGAIRKYATMSNTENSTGDNLSHVSNASACFDLIADVRDCKWCINGGEKMFSTYDTYGAGANLELGYELVDSGVQGARLFFGIVAWAGTDAQYLYNCHGCENCFGCIGLRNKKYCILNTQYTPEDYKALLPKIIEHMNQMSYVDKKGRTYGYGEFFPPELSPFAYNETVTQDYFPITEVEAAEKGFVWRNFAARNYAPTILPEKLPDHIRDVPDSITKEIIGCANAAVDTQSSSDAQWDRSPDFQKTSGCTTAFRIIEPELQFYRRLNLPLPRKCPNCRHSERLAKRNPPKLWKRTCMCGGAEADKKARKNTATHFHGAAHCPNIFETAYNPEREWTVYCEQCYNAEIV